MSIRRLLPMAVIVVPMLALAACQVPSPAQRRLLDSMVGRSPVDLVRQFGVPSRTYSTGGHTFLAYVDQQTGYIPGSDGWGWGGGWGGYGGFGYGGYGGGFGGGGFGGLGYGGYGLGGFPPSYYSSTCATTFDVVGERVLSWSLRGNGC